MGMYNVCSVEPLYEGGRREFTEGKVIMGNYQLPISNYKWRLVIGDW
jgi:hypothetical protein